MAAGRPVALGELLGGLRAQGELLEGLEPEVRERLDPTPLSGLGEKRSCWCGERAAVAVRPRGRERYLCAAHFAEVVGRYRLWLGLRRG
ncbi:hypothetical protein, partial [Ammonifex thiophilus]